MGGKKMNRTISDYISAIAQKAAAGEGQNRVFEERRRTEELIRDLRSGLRPGYDTPVVGEYFADGERVHVVGCIDDLKIDDSGCLGVSMKPGNVVVDGGAPEYRAGSTFIPIGAGAISVTINKGTHLHVRHRGRPTTSFYVGGRPLETVLKADLGYRGKVLSKVTPGLAKKLNSSR
jgi:hypothetical protein